MDTMDIRKREEVEDEQVEVEQQLPPELIQLAGALLQAFLTGDRESVEALYEMYHEPDKFVQRQREAIKQMLRELLDEGKITAEQAQQLQQELDNQAGEGKTTSETNPADEPKPADAQAVQTPPANEQVVIPENQQRAVNPKGKTLHEILGITR
jgi:polyhydroxyalkanoate synthesis regulator phasin